MANSVVMGSSVLEKKMHYPVMTERQVAARWKISLKTLRRWRLDGEGPVWHKLFHHVRHPISKSLSRKEVALGVLHRREREMAKRDAGGVGGASGPRPCPKGDARKPSKHAGNGQEKRPTEKGWPWVNGGGWLTAELGSRSAVSDRCERVRIPVNLRVGNCPGSPEDCG